MEVFRVLTEDIDGRKKKWFGNCLSAALLSLVGSSNSIAEVELQWHTLQDVDPEAAATVIPTLWCCISNTHYFPPVQRNGTAVPLN